MTPKRKAVLSALSAALTLLVLTNSAAVQDAAAATQSVSISTGVGAAPAAGPVPLASAAHDASSSSSEAAAAAAPKPADPAPLPMPAMSGPLQTAPPREFEGGNISVTGILSGMGWTEGDHVSGDNPSHYDVSNAQVFVQKTTGWWQFYLQGGAYNLPAIGVPFLSTVDTMKNIYGPFPQGYVKLGKGNYDVKIGALPTLIGAEYTFSFENMNIERGLLWNQENAVNKGIQLDDTYKKLSLSLSWNDGFYSNRYTWLFGSATYAFSSANSLAFVAGGNAGAYAKNTAATPLYLNNEQIYNLIYTYTKGSWIIQPYYQYTDVPTNARIGISHGANTNGGALLMTYNVNHKLSLSVRPEYIKSSGSTNNGSANLLYGPGSGAFGFTVTPTYRHDSFFMRADVAVVHATNMTAGSGFGTNGLSANQPRAVLETGFMF